MDNCFVGSTSGQLVALWLFAVRGINDSTILCTDLFVTVCGVNAYWAVTGVKWNKALQYTAYVSLLVKDGMLYILLAIAPGVSIICGWNSFVMLIKSIFLAVSIQFILGFAFHL